MIVFRKNNDNTLSKISDKIAENLDTSDTSKYIVVDNIDNIPESKFGFYKYDINNNVILDNDKELDEAKKIAINKLHSVIDYYINKTPFEAPIEIKNIKVNRRNIDLLNIQGLIDILPTDDAETKFRTFDNTVVILTKSQLSKLKTMMIKDTHTIYYKKWYIENIINNSTDIDFVMNYDALNEFNEFTVFSYNDDKSTLVDYITGLRFKKYDSDENKNIVGKTKTYTEYTINAENGIVDSSNNKYYIDKFGRLYDSNYNVVLDDGFDTTTLSDSVTGVTEGSGGFLGIKHNIKIDKDHNIILDSDTNQVIALFVE